MGSSRWSDVQYSNNALLRASTNQPTFAYHAATTAKPASDRTAHPTLSPKGVKVRESRDSVEHPLSRAVAVLCDVTGSMQEVPKIIQSKLPNLMGLLLKKNYLQDPQILIGGVGDAYSDVVPLQIGQFESGIEIENDLTNLYLEGGGGGQMTESYELAMYFMAYHTVIDCLEKRNKRGYLFIIGDEMSYPKINRQQVVDLIGGTPEDNIDVKNVIVDLERKYDVYFINPKLTNHYGNANVLSHWTNLLGQNVIRLEDPNGICELIASIIGVAEGVTDAMSVSADLVEYGTSQETQQAVSSALAGFSSPEMAGSTSS